MAHFNKIVTSDDIVNQLDGDLSDLDILGLSSDDEEHDATYIPAIRPNAGVSESSESDDSESAMENLPMVERPPSTSAENVAGSSKTKERVQKQKTRRMMWHKKPFSEKPWPGSLNFENIEVTFVLFYSQSC